MAKPPRLLLVGEVDLPVVEASGAAAAPDPDGVRVLVVGDRSWVLGSARYNGELSAFQTHDLTEADGWPFGADRASQLEAVAADGAGRVALLREDPSTVVVLEPRLTSVRAIIHLQHGRPQWSTYWDDPASRGEGLALLRDGRLLVVKEKRPAALVEFAPVGADARGVAASDLLRHGQGWDAPTGEVAYEAVAAWPLVGEAAEQLADVSDLGVGPEGDLWLLSDQSRAVARVDLGTPLPASGGPLATFAEVWRLPTEAKKPEGFALLGGGRVLVVLDRDTGHRAGLVVARPDEEH